MRRANGSGSIFKVKDAKRRKPWRVNVTLGVVIMRRQVRQDREQLRWGTLPQEQRQKKHWLIIMLVHMTLRLRLMYG